MVQRMFLGIADGPMNLVGQRPDRLRGFSSAAFGGGNGQREGGGVIAAGRHFGGGARGGCFSGHGRQTVLNRLKLTDRPPELHPVVGIFDAHPQDSLQRASRGQATDKRAQPAHPAH